MQDETPLTTDDQFKFIPVTFRTTLNAEAIKFRVCRHNYPHEFCFITIGLLFEDIIADHGITLRYSLAKQENFFLNFFNDNINNINRRINILRAAKNIHKIHIDPNIIVIDDSDDEIF